MAAVVTRIVGATAAMAVVVTLEADSQGAVGMAASSWGGGKEDVVAGLAGAAAGKAAWAGLWGRSK